MDNIIHKVKLDSIYPSNDNNKIYNAAQEDRIVKLANDIKRNGLLEPLIVSQDNFIISGHTRYSALQFLNRKFVNVRYLDVYSTDENFIQLLTSANDQRIKTDRERMNEIKINIDPAGYKERKEAYLNTPVNLEIVKGKLSSNRAISANYFPLCGAVQDVIIEHQKYLPMSLRSIHYQLLNFLPIASVKSGKRYQNNIASYQLLSRIVVNMRVGGYIENSHIRDDKRKVITNRGYLDKNYYMQEQMQRLFASYSRDLLQTQEHYIAIICEKETVSHQVNMVAKNYCVPVIYTQGVSSYTIRHSLVEDWQTNGSKPMRLLFLSDLDPAGYRIQNSFVGSLQSDFNVPDNLIKAFRIGITLDQVKRLGLSTSMEAKKSDKQYKEFVKITGSVDAYELEALPPEALINEIEEAIKEVIDLDIFNKEVDIYNNEIREVEKRRMYIKSLL